jgi:TonB family protein
MKYLIILFTSLFLFVSCEEKDVIEVIPNYDEIYLPLSKVDSTPQLIEGDETELSEAIGEEVNKSGVKDIKLDYKLLIDEEGNVKKVEVVRSPDIKYTNLAVKGFENWKFLPGKKDGKAVKSQYWWKFYLSSSSSGLVDIDKEEFVLTADEMPEPVGGIIAIQEKIRYPEIAKRAGIEGKVYIKAFIDEEGKVVATDILKGMGSGLDEAAVRAIKETKFIPAKNDGKNVKIQVTVPIVFKL